MCYEVLQKVNSLPFGQEKSFWHVWVDPIQDQISYEQLVNAKDLL